MRAQEIDILVRGAGPVGCALALALRGSHLKVAILGSAAPRAGFRPMALSHASRLILERLGVWQGLAPTPIDTIPLIPEASCDLAVELALRSLSDDPPEPTLHLIAPTYIDRHSVAPPHR